MSFLRGLELLAISSALKQQARQTKRFAEINSRLLDRQIRQNVPTRDEYLLSDAYFRDEQRKQWQEIAHGKPYYEKWRSDLLGWIHDKEAGKSDVPLSRYGFGLKYDLECVEKQLARYAEREAYWAAKDQERIDAEIRWEVRERLREDAKQREADIQARIRRYCVSGFALAATILVAFAR
jgi:hypothetical protein